VGGGLTVIFAVVRVFLAHCVDGGEEDFAQLEIRPIGRSFLLRFGFLLFGALFGGQGVWVLPFCECDCFPVQQD